MNREYKLFHALLLISAILALVVALAVGILATAESQTRSLAYVAVGTWVNNVLINVGAGIIIIVTISLTTRLFRISNQNDISVRDSAVIQSAGIREIITDWILHKPSPEQFYRLFRDSDVVKVIGVTLNRTFISSKWFPEILEMRVKNNKTTQFLLLSPGGAEMARREREGLGRPLKRNAEVSKEQVLLGLRNAGITEPTDIFKYLRYYDFAPQANVLRFGDTIFVVLFMYGLGDRSPAFEVGRDGWLFETYSDHFQKMWADAADNAAATSVGLSPSDQ